MKFKITLQSTEKPVISANYQYALSSAIYKIIEKADRNYSQMLHESGYGKGFKLFSFSDLQFPFEIIGDRLKAKTNELKFTISFHLPQATQTFIKGLFLSQTIDIADKKSRASFSVSSVEALPNPLGDFKEDEIIKITLKPTSPLTAAYKPEGHKHPLYLSPEEKEWKDITLHNWKEKIRLFYNLDESEPLSITPIFFKNPPKPRLITIKADTKEETKIRGFVNFEMEVLGRRKFVELLMNCGIGNLNSQGMGSVSMK